MFSPPPARSNGARGSRPRSKARPATTDLQTYDGFDIAPLYPRASGKPRAFRGAGEWAPTARVDHPDGAQANALALADLENGADGLHVVFAGAAAALRLRPARRRALAPALKNVQLDAGLRILFDLPGDADAFVAAIEALVAARGHEPENTDLSLGLDPLGAAAAFRARR